MRLRPALFEHIVLEVRDPFHHRCGTLYRITKGTAKRMEPD
mgnify:CR=1 FL=1